MDDLLVLAVLAVGATALLCPAVLIVIVLAGNWLSRAALDNFATRRSIVVMRDDETMTTSQVKDLLGLKTTAAARVQLARWNIRAVARDADTGEKHWNRAQVETAHATRAGRGARTDLSPRDPGQYMTKHHNPGHAGNNPFQHYELHAPAGTLNHVNQIVNTSTARLHTLVTETAGEQHVTIVVYNHSAATALAGELLNAGIHLIPAPDRTT